VPRLISISKIQQPKLPPKWQHRKIYIQKMTNSYLVLGI
jgi:hypothetical protein